MTDSELTKLLKKISHIRVVGQRIHGGKNSLKRYKEGIIDFSVCINPFGPPPSVLSGLGHIDIAEYPDPQSNQLKQKIAKLYGVSKDNIIVGNGSSELIALLFFCFVKEEDNIVALWPSFGEYKHYALTTKSKFVPIKLVQPNFELDIESAVEIVRINKPKLFFFCNPINPTGSYYQKGIIEAILEKIPQDTLFIIDEAYINFLQRKWDSTKLLKNHKNLIILRSLTKDYALSALRLGYSISNREIACYLNSAMPSWNVNSLAQYAGILALQNEVFLKETVHLLHKEKTRLEKELKKIGYEVVPSTVNFYLIKVKNSKRAYELLLDKRIHVRDCSSYDLPTYLRLSVKTPVENDYLIKVLKDLAKEIKY